MGLSVFQSHQLCCAMEVPVFKLLLRKAEEIIYTQIHNIKAASKQCDLPLLTHIDLLLSKANIKTSEK